MTDLLKMLERRARYGMAIIAMLSVAALACVKLGWVTSEPSYKDNAWYLVSGSASMVITSEYVDEAACRRKESGVSVCRSGKSLIDEANVERNKASS